MSCGQDKFEGKRNHSASSLANRNQVSHFPSLAKALYPVPPPVKEPPKSNKKVAVPPPPASYTRALTDGNANMANEEGASLGQEGEHNEKIWAGGLKQEFSVGPWMGGG